MDLEGGLSQVLSDGTNEYLYGSGRILQANASDTQYFLGDALGSVRQLADAGGSVSLAKGYDPFGNACWSAGAAQTPYGYTAEQTDANGLVYLRARYYAPEMGRFTSKDVWDGEQIMPMSYNSWLYGYSNPVKYVDPSGNIPFCPLLNELDCLSFFGAIPDYKGLAIVALHKTVFDQMGEEIALKGLHKTTIAAAIAIQSQWMDYPVDALKNIAYQLRTVGCGNPLIEKILNSAGVGFAKSGEFDKYGNLLIMANSIRAMTDRIKPVADACTAGVYLCSPKDKLIAASMAQNVAFGKDDMDLLAKYNRDIGHIFGNSLNIDWTPYFLNLENLSESHPGNPYALLNDLRAIGRKNYNGRFMVQLFTQDMMVLNSVFGWELPPGIGTTDLVSMMSIALLNR